MCVCVCVILELGTHHAIRMRLAIIYGPYGSTVFLNIISQTAEFSGKKILNTKCLFRFSIQTLSETFFIPRRLEQVMIKNVCWSLCKVLVTFFVF